MGVWDEFARVVVPALVPLMVCLSVIVLDTSQVTRRASRALVIQFWSLFCCLPMIQGGRLLLKMEERLLFNVIAIWLLLTVMLMFVEVFWRPLGYGFWQDGTPERRWLRKVCIRVFGIF